MVMLSLLMADKCCLCVTWTECRRAICAFKLPRLQDWKEQDSKSNNYLYFLESAHTAASARICLTVVPKRCICIMAVQPAAVCPYRLIIIISLINRTQRKELQCLSLNLSSLKNVNPELKIWKADGNVFWKLRSIWISSQYYCYSSHFCHCAQLWKCTLKSLCVYIGKLKSQHTMLITEGKAESWKHRTAYLTFLKGEGGEP